MVGHHGDEMSVQKSTCEQMMSGTEAKAQGGCLGKVTAGLNGQQTAHPGSGHLYHSASVKGLEVGS